MRAWILSVMLLVVAGGCERSHEAQKGHDAHDAQEVHWSYSGDTGPEHWGELSPDYATARTGRAQSPIDISNVTVSEPNDLEIHYVPTHVEMFNNGHTIEVKYEEGSYISIDGEKYSLVQFHFHSPSEHTIDQQHAELEAHLVHRNDSGGLAVLALMLVEGEHNSALDNTWERLPTKPGERVELFDAFVNSNEVLPASRRHYRYEGSLTTPPCTEGVIWLVMQESIPLHREQIDRFRSLYHGNNRPVQPLNGRTVVSE